MTSGTLYVIATPIGNLEDISFRAVRVLKEVDVIACEDTRHTRVLLNRHSITTPLVSYHEHNEATRAGKLVHDLQLGRSVALVSDAGTPVLSDPGFALVRRAVAAGITVLPVPGPSAITAALSVAGLPTDRFLFVGFLPRKTAERRRALEEFAPLPWTLVLFEAPHRIAATLRDLYAVLGNRPVAVVRELTKKFEEVIRGTVSDVLARIQQAPPRGELTVVVEGAPNHSLRLGSGQAQTATPAAQLRSLMSSGVPSREAVREVARVHRLPRRTVYQMAVRIKEDLESS